jgi:hypothetical protein
MSSISPFSYIQQCLTQYGITIYTTMGNIGLILNIFIFIQPAHRRSPSSLYILSMSFCALIGLNISLIPIIYGLDHSDPLTSSSVFCKLQFYLRHVFSEMMRTFFVLACADRYAMSSNHARIRSFSRYKVAIRLIPSIILFWLLVGIFPVMLYSLENGRCSGKSGPTYLIFSLYILTVLGILPLVCMIMFCILLLNNLKKIRGRVQPVLNTNPPVNQLLRKRDRDMMRMLLIEVVCYTITTVPFTVTLIYWSVVQTTISNDELRKILLFLIYFTGTFLLYINNSLSFWIYIMASRSFRLELKSLIIKCYVFIMRKEAQILEIN